MWAGLMWEVLARREAKEYVLRNPRGLISRAKIAGEAISIVAAQVF
jgi:hypothetical protein